MFTLVVGLSEPSFLNPFVFQLINMWFLLYVCPKFWETIFNVGIESQRLWGGRGGEGVSSKFEDDWTMVGWTAHFALKNSSNSLTELIELGSSGWVYLTGRQTRTLITCHKILCKISAFILTGWCFCVVPHEYFMHSNWGFSYICVL